MATYWENSCSFGLRCVSWYKYLIVSLVFSHLGFWSGNLFLIAPFPGLCLLVPFHNTSGKEILKSVTATGESTSYPLLGRYWQNSVESPECSSCSEGTYPRKLMWIQKRQRDNRHDLHSKTASVILMC